MNNPVVNWWRSLQFKLALRRGSDRRTGEILEKIWNSGAKLSPLQKVYLEKLQAQETIQAQKQEIQALQHQYTQLSQKIQDYQELLDFLPPGIPTIFPNQEFLQQVRQDLNLQEIDEALVQCTGVDEVFNKFDQNLAQFCRDKVNQIKEQKKKEDFFDKLQSALLDLKKLKKGQDPNYDGDDATVYTYLIRYFLENVYCNYIAWYYIYQNQLLPTNLTMLDIGAGPATVAFGLALLIESSFSFGTQTSPNICYFSLDKQKMFQFRGLQFWRKYIESKQSPPNAYFRFVTKDILKPDLEIEKLPKQFFNFIVISHCFFSDSDSQVCAKHNYTRIIQNCLQPDGYVLLIVQNKKLFRIYNESPSDDIEQEKEIVNKFLGELGLQLVWYKCLSSTESRQPLGRKRFRQYATDRLAAQQYISKVAQEYLGIPYDYSYVLDDYIILASYN